VTQYRLSIRWRGQNGDGDGCRWVAVRDRYGSLQDAVASADRHPNCFVRAERLFEDCWLPVREWETV
jgi:hypothetical protein